MDAVKRMEDLLKGAGYLVYEPGIHPDACKQPYIVIVQMGTYASLENMDTGYTLTRVNLYVPLGQRAALADMARAVKAVLLPLRHQARQTGHETPDMIEPEYRAHSRSIEYMTLKRLRE